MIKKIREEIKELYEEYRIKYSLDKLEDLEKEFGIYISERKHPILFLLNKTYEILQKYHSFLIVFIEPKGLITNYENKMLSNKYKEKVFEVYKKIIALSWKYLADYEKDEEHKIGVLKDRIRLIREIRPFIIELGEKMNKNWLKKKTKEKKKNILTY